MNIISAIIFFLSATIYSYDPDNYTFIGMGSKGTYYRFQEFDDKKESLHTVAEKWGIKLGSVGCNVDKQLSWKVTKSNFECELNMIRKFGFNWLQEFRKEVDRAN